MSLSIIDAQRDVILQALRATSKGEWKTLVLDKKSKSIVDNVLDQDTILDEKITHIEELEKRREPNPSIEAIYLLTPRPDVFERLYSDLRKQQYKKAHLIWTSIPPDENRNQLIKTPELKANIESYKVLNIEFFAQESHLVTFRDPWETIYLFHPMCAGLVQNHIEDIAQKIVGVCVALGEYPSIRYYMPSSAASELMDAARSYKTVTPPAALRHLLNREQKKWSCQLLAKFVQDELDLYAKFHQDFPPVTTRPRGVLYITDRSLDLAAPLLHEFTYQAMIFDLLPIYSHDKIQFKTKVNEGEAPKMLDIHEADDIWVEYRHRHAKDTIDELIQRFARYNEKNSMYTQQDDGAASLTRIKQMMAGLPEYQAQKEQYTLHLTMLQEAMDMFVTRNLGDLATLEQMLATGLDVDNRKPKFLADQMVRMLDDDQIETTDRLRLIALYQQFKDGLLPADLEKLLLHSRVNPTKRPRLDNFDLLGLNTQRKLKENRQRPAPVLISDEPPPTIPPPTYALGRFKTAVEILLAKHAANKVDQEVFPYTRPPLDDLEDTGAIAAAATSLRTTKATWASSKRKQTSSENRQRVIIYMGAGATYSESRACYEASAKTNKEVVLVSSHMLGPDLFLRQIGHLTEQIGEGRLEPPLIMQSIPGYRSRSQGREDAKEREPASRVSLASSTDRASQTATTSSQRQVPLLPPVIIPPSQYDKPPLPNLPTDAMANMGLNAGRPASSGQPAMGLQPTLPQMPSVSPASSRMHTVDPSAVKKGKDGEKKEKRGLFGRHKK